MYDERIYAQALTSVAVGETYENTLETLQEMYPHVAPARLIREMKDAYRDALKQGVEREDIDPSWHHQRRDDLITDALGIAPGETLRIEIDEEGGA